MPGAIVEAPEEDYLAICFGIPRQYLGPLQVKEDDEKALTRVEIVQERIRRVDQET